MKNFINVMAIGLLFIALMRQAQAQAVCTLTHTDKVDGNTLTSSLWNTEWSNIKQCAADAIGNKLDKSGGTITGKLGIGSDAAFSLTSPPAVGRLHLFLLNPTELGTNNQLLIGSTGYTGNLAQIGFGWTNAPIHFAPSVIAHVTTNQDGHTFGDLIFATRGTNADVAPAERMRIAANGDITMAGRTFINDRLYLFSGIGGMPLDDIPSGAQRAAIGLRIEKSGPAVLEFSTPPDSASSGLLFSDNTFAEGQIIYDHPTDTMLIRAGSEKVRVNDPDGDVLTVKTFRPAGGDYNLLKLAALGGSDTKLVAIGDGSLKHEGIHQPGVDLGDFAEYFCGALGETTIPIGTTVVLESEKIRPAAPGEQPIGAVRPRRSSAIITDSGWNDSGKKYLRDDYGAPIYEDVQFVRWTEEIKDENGGITKELRIYRVDLLPSNVTVPENAEYFLQRDRKLNPEYDPTAPFVPKEERRECYVIGLLGKVPITKGQPVADNWVKIKDVSDTVELWLIK
ncbi:MAG: hypothetical protein HYY44_06975 [Deltaproteobacteria bacterium]|nr:hypothetical protein [Deltaproteobacteria bacterium]